MKDYGEIRIKAQEQAEKAWDERGIESWFKKLLVKGIPEKRLDHKEILLNKEVILDRVRQRAEDCEFMAHS